MFTLIKFFRIQRFLPWILIIFISSTYWAEAQKIIYSPKHVTQDRFNNLKIIGQSEKGIFALQSNLPFELDKDRIGLRNRKFKVKFFDYQLNQRWDLDPESITGEMQLESIDFFLDKLLFTQTQIKRSDNTIELVGQMIGDDGRTVGSKKSLGKFKIQNTNAIDKAILCSSLDKSIISIMIPEERSEEIVAHIAVCDSLLNVIRTISLVFPYRWKDFSIRDFKISNQGDILVLGNVVIKSKESKRQRNYEYHLFSCLQDEKVFTEQNIHSNDVYAAEAGLSIDEFNNVAIVAGLYASKTNFHATGIFKATLSLVSGSSIVVNPVKMSDDAQKELVGERSFKSGTDISNYPVRFLIPRQDGGMIMVTESEYVYQYSYYDYFSQTFTIRNEYYLDNILLFSISNDNIMEWSKSIRKNQYSVDDEGVFSSFLTLITPGEIGFIYNQEISRFSNLQVHLFNATGKANALTVAKPNEHVLIFPGWGKQVNVNQIAIPVLMKKKLFLSLLSF